MLFWKELQFKKDLNSYDQEFLEYFTLKYDKNLNQIYHPVRDLVLLSHITMG